MAVLGLLSVLLVGGIRVASRSWSASEDKIEKAEELRLAQSIVRERLAEAYPIVPPSPSAPTSEKRPVAFVGTKNGVQFVGFLPPELGLGGLYRFGFTAAGAGANRQLVMTQQRLQVRRDGLSPFGEPEQRVLLDTVQGISFRYFGIPTGEKEARWQTEWQDNDKLPQLVVVDVAFTSSDRRVWPELVIAPMITAPTDCVFDPGAKKCRSLSGG
jgi:hypothetical protein